MAAQTGRPAASVRQRTPLSETGHRRGVLFFKNMIISYLVFWHTVCSQVVITSYLPKRQQHKDQATCSPTT